VQLDIETIQKIRKEVKGILQTAGIYTPPTDIFKLLEVVNLKPQVIDFEKELSNCPPGLKSKVNAILDAKSRLFFINNNLHSKQAHFAHFHELADYVLGWHRATLEFGNEHDLPYSVYKQFKLESDRFAAECIFQIDRFAQDVDDLGLKFQSIITCANDYNGSYSSAIRHYAETSKRECAFLILKPNYKFGVDGTDLISLSNDFYYLHSYYATISFKEKYPKFKIRQKLSGYALAKMLYSPTNDTELRLNFADNFFAGEIFSNGYDTFILMQPYKSRVRKKIYL
jgi:Zn-dependent peptidase ImmA (M78 family)